MSIDLVAILRKHGVPNVEDHRVPGHGALTPVGVINHHTATAGPALQSCIHGRPDLSGPLCNINLTRAGVVNVVSDGAANHAGAGSAQVHLDVLADRPITQDAADRHLPDDFAHGNTVYIGIEVDNDGVGEDLPPAQLAALVAVNAALVAEFGWTPHRCIHHRQHTKRKQDMHWRGDLPALVAAHLNPQEDLSIVDAQTKTYLDMQFAALNKRIDDQDEVLAGRNPEDKTKRSLIGRIGDKLQVKP